MKPLKIWAYSDNFFFHSFQGGTKGKMLKNCQNYTLVFEVFFPMEKRCRKELKFCEVLNPAFTCLSQKLVNPLFYVSSTFVFPIWYLLCSGPWEIKIFHKSQPLESSNHEFESSKNIVITHNSDRRKLPDDMKRTDIFF